MSWTAPVITMVTRRVSVAILTDRVLAWLPLPNGEGYVFIPVGWFVCLSVSNITGKRMNGFLWNFHTRSSKIQGTICKNGVLCLTPSIEERRYIEVYSSMIQFFYILIFSQKSVPVSNITGKRMNGFSWNFQEILHMRQRTIWNIFGSWWLTPWIQGRFFYFMNP